MAICVQRVTDGFNFFPYPPDHENGRTNNGGVDLVRHPKRLDEISELRRLPDIKLLMKKLNEPEGHFMTLGFEAGPSDDGFYGYLEWALREPELAKKRGVYQEITDAFVAWVARDHPQWSQAVDIAIVAEIQAFHYHGSFHGDRATFWFRAPSQDGFESLVNLLGHFLLKQFSPRGKDVRLDPRADHPASGG